jgi:catechol 2,3-dioxygenase-like lactoylglutathione lyase family enzyme
VVRGINHVTLSVVDIEESFAFYAEVLGFRAVMRSGFSAYLQAGDLAQRVRVGKASWGDSVTWYE